MYVCMYVCMYACMYICIMCMCYVCVRAHVYTYMYVRDTYNVYISSPTKGVDIANALTMPARQKVTLKQKNNNGYIPPVPSTEAISFKAFAFAFLFE